MKKLTNLDDRIPQLDPDDKKENLPTYRKLLRILLGHSIPKNQDESLDLHQVLLKLRLDSSEIELENASFRMIVERVKENPVKMLQHSHGPLMAYISEQDKANDKKD